jgi:hypothetical protein
LKYEVYTKNEDNTADNEEEQQAIVYEFDDEIDSILSEYAPHLFFGSHEGDPACVGFFEREEEDDE